VPRGRRGYLPASSVRAFLHPSCPSFGCFHGRHLVGSFTPGRRAARGSKNAQRERERERREKERSTPRGTRRNRREGGRGGGGGLVETRGREKEEEEEEGGRRKSTNGEEGSDGTYGSPTTEATSAGEGIPQIPVPVREGVPGGTPENARRVDKVDEREEGEREREREKSAAMLLVLVMVGSGGSGVGGGGSGGGDGGGGNERTSRRAGRLDDARGAEAGGTRTEERERAARGSGRD